VGSAPSLNGTGRPARGDAGGGGSLRRVAYAVGSVTPVLLVSMVESDTARTVENDGPGPCAITKDPVASPTAADAFIVVANTQQEVYSQAGESLHAICPSGQTASLEVI
jgi:hypothetical protein